MLFLFIQFLSSILFSFNPQNNYNLRMNCVWNDFSSFVYLTTKHSKSKKKNLYNKQRNLEMLNVMSSAVMLQNLHNNYTSFLTILTQKISNKWIYYFFHLLCSPTSGWTHTKEAIQQMTKVNKRNLTHYFDGETLYFYWVKLNSSK